MADERLEQIITASKSISDILKKLQGRDLTFLQIGPQRTLRLSRIYPDGEICKDKDFYYIHRKGESNFIIVPETSPDQPATIQETQASADANIQNGFYQIDKTRILSATTPEYRQFLREAGYGDLEACSGIEIAKGVLRIDQTVRDAATRSGLSLTGNDGDYVVNITHPDARKLVEAMGYKVPTVGLMYRLLIPCIKDLARQGNAEAQATLDEMINTKAEWLEDLVKDKRDIHIGTKSKRLSLPDKDGRFDRSEINEFGYPDVVKNSGEFYYWCPRDNQRAAIRDRVSGLSLVLYRGPSVVDGVLGVRPQKIFP